MFSSIYNDNIFDTNKLFFKNLIKLYHFSSTVRTPPNNYQNNFIGELKFRKKPNYDLLLTNSFNKASSSLFNYKIKKLPNKIVKVKSYNLPKLLIANNNINNYNYSKSNKFFLTNNYFKKVSRLGIIDLNFPYCKSKLKASKSNVILSNKNKIKKRFLNTINNDKINYKKSHRLFFKSLSNFHQIIKKINKEQIQI